MLRVEGLGEGDVALLEVSSRDDLSWGLAVCGGWIGEGGLGQEGLVPVAERVPGLKDDAGVR